MAARGISRERDTRPTCKGCGDPVDDICTNCEDVSLALLLLDLSDEGNVPDLPKVTRDVRQGGD
tara:strand:- start:1515 stop:1706 length:192 start_codon:yes stop_codon:yes gene_type:complete